jgi:hypothetical protein
LEVPDEGVVVLITIFLNKSSGTQTLLESERVANRRQNAKFHAALNGLGRWAGKRGFVILQVLGMR